MDKDDIISLPNDHLRARSKKVGLVDDQVKQLISDMQSATLDWEDYEGCLSVPDIYGKVPRYSRVRIKAQDERGREFRVTAEGFLARVFQHEIDHTNGLMFIDHIKNNERAFFQLLDDGHLQQLDYEKNVRDNRILW